MFLFRFIFFILAFSHLSSGFELRAGKGKQRITKYVNKLKSKFRNSKSADNEEALALKRLEEKKNYIQQANDLKEEIAVYGDKFLEVRGKYVALNRNEVSSGVEKAIKTKADIYFDFLNKLKKELRRLEEKIEILNHTGRPVTSSPTNLSYLGGTSKQFNAGLFGPNLQGHEFINKAK